MQKVRGVFAALGGLALLQSGQSGAHAGSASRARAVVPEARTWDARVPDELSTVHVVACDGPGENGEELYVYEDTNRSTFRVGRPGWAGPAGFSTLEEAIAVGCTAERVATRGLRVR